MEEILDILKTQTLTRLLSGLAALVVCLVVSKYVARLLDRALKRARHVEPTLHTFLLTAARWVMYFLSVLVAANTVGVPITSFVAVLSVAGLAVSLAVQGVLSNLAGGMIILAGKPFVLGDYIEAGGISGTVKDIGFLHTRLATPDGKLIFMPNSELYTSKLVNCTALGARRVEYAVSASYDNSPEEVRAAVLLALQDIDGVRKDPPPEVLVQSYADSAIQYTIHVWTAPADYLNVLHALSERLYSAFKACGVEMTYPHLNVHMK